MKKINKINKLNNLVVGVFTIGSIVTGLMGTLYSIMVGIFIISLLFYLHIPWAHRNWRTEAVIPSGNPFYSFSKIIHAAIYYSLVSLIVTSLLVGLVAKSGPQLLANQTAEYVLAGKKWKTKSKIISSSTLPEELKNGAEYDQPYTVIIDQNTLKAAPLHETLAAVAGSYSITLAHYQLVLFLFVFVAGLVLYPTEILEDVRSKKSEG